MEISNQNNFSNVDNQKKTALQKGLFVLVTVVMLSVPIFAFIMSL